MADGFGPYFVFSQNGGSQWDTEDPKVGFIDYNDTATAITPIVMLEDDWTTITNDGLGPFTNKTFRPEYADELMINNGQFDFSQIPLGYGVDIRQDFSVTPTINRTLVEARYQIGAGPAYTLETTVGELVQGSGRFYRFALYTHYVYMGDTNTRNNPLSFQLKASSDCTVVNAGCVVRVSRS